MKSEERAANVKWMKQTIGNACGTIGILHSLINSNIPMNDGSIMANFLANCNGKSGEEIGKMLEESHEIANLHKVTGSSSANQTQADETTQVHDHFVALVHVDGSIYEVITRYNFIPNDSTLFF